MGAAYFFLATSLRQRDRAAIISSMTHMRDEYRDEGIPGLEREAAVQISRQGKDAHLIRLLSRNGRELLKMRTASRNGFNLEKAFPAVPRNALRWLALPGTRDGQIMELASWRLSNGDILQVGNSDAAREDVLERFRWILAAVFLPAVLLGFIGGFLIARRALSPVRDLIETLEAVESGAMGVRAPLRHTGDELQELTELFNGMMGRIETLVSGMKNALDNVAHDLRTPMTRLRAVAELPLRSEAGTSDCREALADCIEESDKVLGMLDTLMDISEAETGTIALALEPVDVSEFLREAHEAYHYAAEEKGLRVEVAAEKNIRVLCDRSRMRRVISNLLDNAVKYTPSGGEIRLTAAREGTLAAITVRDTGVGIPPQDMPRIWERLYRSEAGRSQRGLGLGLSLVKAIVQAHDGSVDVSSSPGAGSRFTVRLKLAS